jgi:hypothetical protein
MALWRNRLALVKAESTYNTNPTPAATDALLFTELEVEPLSLELIERETIQPYFGNRASIVGQRSVPISATVEMAGSGTAGTAPRFGPMLKASGLGETIVADTSVTYAPVSADFSSYAMDFYIDNGSRQAIGGIRGTAELALSVGSIPTIAFSHMGIWSAPTAVARPSETYSAQASPVAVNADNTATVSVHGFSACMTEFSLSLGTEMVFEQKAGCTKQVRLTDRKTTGSITIELPAFATKDFVAIASAQTEGTISWVHGGTAGNIITFTAAQAAFDSPTFVENDSVTHITLPFRLMPTSSGNDDFTLAFT